MIALPPGHLQAPKTRSTQDISPWLLWCVIFSTSKYIRFQFPYLKWRLQLFCRFASTGPCNTAYLLSPTAGLERAPVHHRSHKGSNNTLTTQLHARGRFSGADEY